MAKRVMVKPDSGGAYGDDETLPRVAQAAQAAAETLVAELGVEGCLVLVAHVCDDGSLRVEAVSHGDVPSRAWTDIMRDMAAAHGRGK